MPESIMTSPTAEPEFDEEAASLAAARSGDPVSITKLYQRHVRSVYRYLYSQVGNPGDAEDLTSQTFLHALESLPRYRHRGRFAAWLFTIARHKAIDHFRRNRRQMPLETVTAAADGPDPAAQAIETHERRLLATRLQTLRRDERELLRLRYVAELSFGDIANVLGKREDAVKKSLYRLLARLQDEMESEHD